MARYFIADQKHIWARKPGEKQSPYSPHNPTSALFADGIMTPGWVGKYRDQQPAIVVAFHDLWESIDKDPLHASTISGMERDHDGITATEINEQKSNAIASGAKFAVVFTLKKSQSDHPVVEERLAYFKRTCALDRNVVFTLSVLGADGSLKDLSKPLERYC
jgi:hypothetical protein